MARKVLPWMFGLGLFAIGAFAVGFAAVALSPFREFMVQKAFEHGISLPRAVAAQPTVADPEHSVKYVGTLAAGVEHFQNIFYAEDTSGKNRFHPPIPFKPVKNSVYDATKEGAWCPQGTGDIFPFTSRITNISENCLSLRIARPAGTKPDAKLPVMVWLHGGGHALGSGSDILYTPDGLIKQAVADKQPVIWVAINYRLGFFGFATSKAIVDSKHGNVGLRDQRAALEWVGNNIAKFGGDPRKVTAIGQSVGASDISLQMTAFNGERGAPFQQAILMSGGPGLNFNTKATLVKENTEAVAKEVGCVKKDSQSFETIECLRTIPMEKLANLSVSAMRAARPPFGEGFFFPTFDNDFIRDRPSELVRAGKVAKKIPVLASWVTNDGAWYPSPTVASDDDVLASFTLWLENLSKATQQGLLDLYPVKDFEDMVRPEYDGPISPQYYRAAQINRDLWFTCPAIDFAWQYARKGGVELSQVHMYEHNSTRFTPSFEMMGVPMWRVSHLSDIPYVLNIQQMAGGADNSPAALKLSATMSKQIVRFAVSGAPTARAADWPAAFINATAAELKVPEYPKEFAVQLFGGPYGNTVVKAKKECKPPISEAEEAIHKEKLIARCNFINSPEVREQTGV
jgi:carboxylesterase type B